MNNESSSGFINAHNSHRMGARVTRQRHDESNAVLNQPRSSVRCGRKVANAKPAVLKPCGGGPFWRSSEGNLRGHYIGIYVGSHGFECGSDARGQACVMFLNATTERQTDAKSARIGMKILHNRAMERGAGCIGPALHGVVVVILLS